LYERNEKWRNRGERRAGGGDTAAQWWCNKGMEVLWWWFNRGMKVLWWYDERKREGAIRRR
jgi:hypothetical protein